MDEIEIETVAEYACEDADMTLQLFEILEFRFFWPMKSFLLGYEIVCANFPLL